MPGPDTHTIIILLELVVRIAIPEMYYRPEKSRGALEQLVGLLTVLATISIARQMTIVFTLMTGVLLKRTSGKVAIQEITTIAGHVLRQFLLTTQEDTSDVIPGLVLSMSQLHT